MVGLGQAIAGITVGTVDAADMYRAALVQCVAALDSYVHDVVLDYAVEIVKGSRGPGSPTRVGLHISAVGSLTSAQGPVELELRARAAINERLSQETYQKPDDVSKAFAMVGIQTLWQGAFGHAAGTVKRGVSLVVGRRNRIVHRCDLDPAGTGTVLPISDVDAIDAIDTIAAAVAGIDSFV
ncbi:hypothetical protein C5U48_09435 [Mycolicibacter virginiensis]|uniref:Uncharacterized protein n=1 Tax=Mycolicibacter virginiensis TaxID=1795032 RepID=A0A9X7IP50_9MYCO|nr:hypothetical protein C5U48_09435 [Mycolicibacter virginiensis]